MSISKSPYFRMDRLGRLSILVILVFLFLGYAYLSAERLMKAQVGRSTNQEYVHLFNIPSIFFCGSNVASVAEERVKEGNGYLVDYAVGSITTNITWRPEHQYKHVDPKRFFNGNLSEEGFRWDRFSYHVRNIGLVTCDRFSSDGNWKMPTGISYPLMFFLKAWHLPAANPFIYVLLGEPDDGPMLLVAQQGISTIFSGRTDLKEYQDKSMMMEEEVTFNAMELTKTKALARSDVPCKEKKELELNPESYHRCLWRYYSDKYSCLNKKRYDTSGCNETVGLDVFDQIQALMGSSNLEIYQETGCLEPCLTHGYRLELSPSVKRPTRYNQSHQLRVFVPQPVLTIKEEFAVFTASSFVAECGGMGGILLGFSFLAMFDWANRSWAKQWANWRKRR